MVGNHNKENTQSYVAWFDRTFITDGTVNFVDKVLTPCQNGNTVYKNNSLIKTLTSKMG